MTNWSSFYATHSSHTLCTFTCHLFLHFTKAEVCYKHFRNVRFLDTDVIRAAASWQSMYMSLCFCSTTCHFISLSHFIFSPSLSSAKEKECGGQFGFDSRFLSPFSCNSNFTSPGKRNLSDLSVSSSVDSGYQGGYSRHDPRSHLRDTAKASSSSCKW